MTDDDDYITDTPEVDALIKSVMKKHPGLSHSAQAVYYEDVHQDLAPFARRLEQQRNALADALDDMLTAFCMGDDWKGTAVYDNAKLALAGIRKEARK